MDVNIFGLSSNVDFLWALGGQALNITNSKQNLFWLIMADGRFDMFQS